MSNLCGVHCIVKLFYKWVSAMEMRLYCNCSDPDGFLVVLSISNVSSVGEYVCVLSMNMRSSRWESSPVSCCNEASLGTLFTPRGTTGGDGSCSSRSISSCWRRRRIKRLSSQSGAIVYTTSTHNTHTHTHTHRQTDLWYKLLPWAGKGGERT